MDIYFLKALNEYRQRKDFSTFSVEEFQRYCQNKFIYPIAIFFVFITNYWSSADNLKDYNVCLNYFKQIIPYLYDGIYNDTDQQIIIKYLTLLNTSRVMYGSNEITMQQLAEGINLIPTSTEAQAIQQILKYNYVEFLILYSPDDQEYIDLLLAELELNPPQQTLNELSRYKEN